MRQSIKIFLCVALLGAGMLAVWGNVGIGPVAGAPDTWQTTANGFNPFGNNLGIPGGGAFGQPSILNTGPRKIGEAYRPNSTVWFYACDTSFLDYFGSNGLAAVNQTFTILNNAFLYTNAIATNALGVDGFGSSLSQMPNNSQHRNTTAFALELTDLKSTLLWNMTPHLGLEQPDRYVWVLFQAFLPNTTPPGTCPNDEEFLVGMRNLGIVPGSMNPPLFQYSPYINDELYTYRIYIGPNCAPAQGLQPTFMVENFPADPFGIRNSPVASWGLERYGGFYTSLTRDDEMGLLYNLTTNRINWETPATGALLITTNLGGQTFLTTSNLNPLLLAIPTNDPGTFGGLFPDVVLAGTTTNWSIVTNWNVVYATNLLNGAPYGSSVVPSVSSNIVGTAWQASYAESFANVITNGNVTNYPGMYYFNNNPIKLQYTTNSTFYVVTVVAHQPIGSPYGTIVTNSYTNKIVSPVASGEYIVLPASQCGWQFLSSQSTYTPTVVSNAIPLPASATVSTNYPIILSQYSLSFFTNHTYLVQPITCGTATPTAGFYQGVEKMQFKRADYDSLLGQFFRPVTNNYSAVLVTNSQMVRQYFQRVVTAPDITISAADIPPNLPTTYIYENLPQPTFAKGALYTSAAGPGTINPPVTFTLNKIGELFLNGPAGQDTNQFLTEGMQTTASYLNWASFDGSTNAPVLYPNGADLQNLAYQMVIQVTPTPGVLPDGYTTSAMNVPFSVTGGGAFTKPYVWSATGLPSGLQMVFNPDSTGALIGTPSQTGTFDITVQLTDSVGRPVSWNYAITIH